MPLLCQAWAAALSSRSIAAAAVSKVAITAIALSTRCLDIAIMPSNLVQTEVVN